MSPPAVLSKLGELDVGSGSLEFAIGQGNGVFRDEV
jgi:hypothetical protein